MTTPEIEREIGALALEMKRTEVAVRKWMREEGAVGHFVEASQAPGWPVRVAAEKEFYFALEAAIMAELAVAKMEEVAPLDGAPSKSMIF